MLITAYIMLITSLDPVTHKPVTQPIKWHEEQTHTLWHSKLACLARKFTLRLNKGESSSCVEVQVPLETAEFDY